MANNFPQDPDANPTREPAADNPKNGSGWNIVWGIWLMSSPFILGYAAIRPALFDDLIVGAIVFVFGIVGASLADETWSRWINIIAGIWLFFSSFILGFTGTAAAVWNNVILGVLVIIFSGWSLSSINRLHHAHA
ncbi:MAG: SPW repeat protein [Patescibacteria group bacterium]|nr:SPW repeat protein [Patescibacteria group bacterium]